ncbi:class I SAM-dependent methyltransferase [Pelagibacterium luteolum]|uniref:Methyltransferase domain-containing protein n=1 Tax=Pelagibacterium luteolum TaxID=440168 RepID=A0A1G7ZDQ1_9HYPH|nr:class I SAM-dependent methyltransferase [Pelagibacterium luteolum]SDH06697.1 Methyltransferase domain-containing protein [Pelagibacterium luteolum]
MAKIDTKTEGLDLYVYVAKTFADSPWLHYGLWEPGERPNIPQLRMAQERYVDKLLSLIPPAPGRLLDIGGGTGEMAKVLLDKGYSVEMITPSHLQAEVAAEKLGPNAKVHETKFETFSGTGPFDICMFSESFQYVKLDVSLEKLKALLVPGGHVVIADCFRSEGYEGGRQPGGGHRYTEFLTAIERHGFELVESHDVTKAAAQTMAVDQQVYRGFVAPTVEQVTALLSAKRPILFRIGSWLYKIFVPKKERQNIVERLKADYRSPEAFERVNTYRFLLLKSLG